MMSQELAIQEPHAIDSRSQLQQLVQQHPNKLVSAIPYAMGGTVIAGIILSFGDTLHLATQGSPAAESAVINTFCYALVFGFFGIVVGTIAYGCAHLGMTSYYMRRYIRHLDTHHWRPRLGFTHPNGRSDTHPRWEITRNIIGETVGIGLIRWIYREDMWQQQHDLPLHTLTRTFDVEELTEAEAYSESIIRLGEQLLAEHQHQLLIQEQETKAVEVLAQGKQELLRQWQQRQSDSTIISTESDIHDRV